MVFHDIDIGFGVELAEKAIGAGTVPVENQAMLGQFEPEPPGNDGVLPPFDFLIAKFLDPPAFQAQDMVVVIALIDLKTDWPLSK
jgi:hypothetical protein